MSRSARGPRVGLQVEPRLLHDVLVDALVRRGIEVIDLRVEGSCDIVLTSDLSKPVADASLVLCAGPSVSIGGVSIGGLSTVADLLAVIDAWATEPAVARSADEAPEQ